MITTIKEHHHLPAGAMVTMFMLSRYLMAQNFTPTAAPDQNWVSITCSGDGTKLAAVGSYGFLYLSQDAGTTWTAASTVASGFEPQRPWQGLASSWDGSRLVAVASFSPVLISTNSGQTWTASGPSADWAAVASSIDGTRLVVADHAMGGVYISTDSGVSWAVTTAPKTRWRSLASSADGSSLFASADFGTNYDQVPGLYCSHDSGATWKLAGAPAKVWQRIACSADGLKVVVAAPGGGIYLSNDGGVHWSPANVPTLHWTDASSSSDGTRLIAAASEGQIYCSTDSGATWNAAAAPAASWQAIACSSDGRRAFAGIWNVWGDEVGGIFTAETPPTLNIFNLGHSAVLSWPASATGFKLQESSDLTAATWTDVPVTPTLLAAGKQQVFVPVQSGNHFFRLVRR